MNEIFYNFDIIDKFLEIVTYRKLLKHACYLTSKLFSTKIRQYFAFFDLRAEEFFLKPKVTD